MARLENKIALVTGAGQGIGAGISAALAEEGAKVIVSDMDVGKAKTTANQIGSNSAIQLNVTSETDWTSAAQHIHDAYGRLDVLVNNAGVELVQSVEDLTLEAWRSVQAVNVDGVFLGAKTMLPLLTKAGEANPRGGSIVNMSSIAGMVGIADQLAYNTSKGAVRQMTKGMAIEFAAKGYNVRVNSVHPGCIDTPMLTGVMEDWMARGVVETDDISEVKAFIESLHPLKRIGDVTDIAMGVVYLASDEAGFMTGSELVIDGGWIAQ